MGLGVSNNFYSTQYTEYKTQYIRYVLVTGTIQVRPYTRTTHIHTHRHTTHPTMYSCMLLFISFIRKQNRSKWPNDISGCYISRSTTERWHVHNTCIVSLIWQPFSSSSSFYAFPHPEIATYQRFASISHFQYFERTCVYTE